MLINFPFFRAMRSKLLSRFNIEEIDSEGEKFYTVERLQILYNSNNLLNSEYCSPEFRESINEFFAEQECEDGLIGRGLISKEIQLVIKSEIEYSLLVPLELLHKYETFEEANEYIDSLKKEDERVLVPKVDSEGFFRLKYQRLISNLTNMYESRDYYLSVHTLEAY